MKLNPLFSDGAVFQRDQQIAVWGRTAAGDLPVQAELAGKKAYTRSRRDGSFLLRLPPMPAGGPYELSVSAPGNGERVVIHDILIGEVWLASGQSNMEYELGSEWAALLKEDPEKRAAAQKVSRAQFREYLDKNSEPDRIRYFKVERCASGLEENEAAGSWKNMREENAGGVSAVAAWFALNLMERLQVPVGILFSAWGGTGVDAWTSRSGLAANPDTAKQLSAYDEKFSQPHFWEVKEKKTTSAPAADPIGFARKDPGIQPLAADWAAPDFDDSSWQEMKVPGSWVRQSIAGNGAVWIRREIELPADWAGRELVLETGGIDKHDIAYFNGQEIGRTGTDFETQYYCIPRRYPVPAALTAGRRAVIAIRAFSFLYDGAFGGSPDSYRIYPADAESQAILLAGVWKVHSEFDWGWLAPKAITEQPLPGNPSIPGILFDGMIRPLCRYALRGAIWYQGENNASTFAEALQYSGKLAAMIRDWRTRWELGDFPFIQVQLANFAAPADYDGFSGWPVLREQQDKVCGILSNVCRITAIDAGETLDIHPQNKRTVGFRLAALALKKIYGCPDSCGGCGPVLKQWKMENGGVRLSFENAAGLHFRKEHPGSFQLAGADRKFHPADAVRIEDNTVVVSSSAVKNPESVRYAWAQNPESILFNGDDLPMFPFRTDSWELMPE